MEGALGLYVLLSVVKRFTEHCNEAQGNHVNMFDTKDFHTVCDRDLSMPSYAPPDFSSTDVLEKKKNTHTHTPACSRPEEGEKEDDKRSSKRS